MAPIKCDNQGTRRSRGEVAEDALALIDAGGNGSERRYSYGDLFRMSGAVARALQRRGLKRGERVAILSANRAEYLFRSRAMQAGLVAVPVNWKLPAETVGFIVDDSDARLVIGDEGAARRWRQAACLRCRTIAISNPYSHRAVTPTPSARCLCGARSQRCSSIRRADRPPEGCGAVALLAPVGDEPAPAPPRPVRPPRSRRGARGTI